MDHCEALFKVFKKGKIGEFYNIGSNKNLNNIEVAMSLLNIANNYSLTESKVKIKYVKDRPGHDIRYALNSNKIKKMLKWSASTKFKDGLKKTFFWYFNNKKYYNSISKKDIKKRFGIKK